MKYRIIWIVALIVVMNIFIVPFISDENGLIVGEDESVHALSFADMIENMEDGDYANDSEEIPIEGKYYFGGLICASFVLISALCKGKGACVVGSVAGILLLAHVFYQIYLGSTEWYMGLSDAHLTIGYYISFIGFISMLVAAIYKKTV